MHEWNAKSTLTVDDYSKYWKLLERWQQRFRSQKRCSCIRITIMTRCVEHGERLSDPAVSAIIKRIAISIQFTQHVWASHQQRKIAFAIPWLCKAYLHHATPPFIASLILSRRIIWKMMQNWKICEHWFQIILVKFSNENCHWLYGIMTENKCSKMEICWWWWQRYVPNTHTPKFEFKFKIPHFKFRACRRVFFDGLKCPLWLW